MQDLKKQQPKEQSSAKISKQVTIVEKSSGEKPNAAVDEDQLLCPESLYFTWYRAGSLENKIIELNPENSSLVGDR